MVPAAVPQGSGDAGGAGYGGAGANGATNPSTERGGQPYGSAVNPINLGSGGGLGTQFGSQVPCAGNGGGALIVSAQTANINGTINANGGTVGNCTGGGGSGGSVNIQAATLSGAGSIAANGGNNPNSNSGAGGGGRIWVQGATTNSFSGTCAAAGGTNTANSAENGQPGTSFCSRPAAPSVAGSHPARGRTTRPPSTSRSPGPISSREAGTYLKLTQTGQSDNSASSVTVQSSTQITGVFNLLGQSTGSWNVVVINPDGQTGTLANGFLIVSGSQIVWTGNAGDGQWNTAGNWNPPQVPMSSSTVTIDATATVTAAGTAINFLSLALGDNAGTFSPTLVMSTTTASQGSVTLYAHSTWQQNTASQVAVASMTVLSGAALTQTFNGATSTEVAKVNLFLST